MGSLRRASLLVPPPLLAACATPEPPPPAPAPPPPAALAPKPPAKPEIVSQPLKHLLGRDLKPMPEVALDVRARCTFRDVAGGRAWLDLLVAQAEVKRFSAEVNIPRQGVCRFDMKQFTQTGKLPQVELSDAVGGCVVHMWEQERAVTVAFSGCSANCSGDAFSYLWPIRVDARNGRCS